MKIIKTSLPDLYIFEPKIFNDERGFFFESFNQTIFEEKIGEKLYFVQDNHSKSSKGVIRGLHYQKEPHAQGKLVRCISGEIFDVAVDIRRSSPTFGEWFGTILSSENKRQLWIPRGFAHGFLAMSEDVEIVYKADSFYDFKSEKCIMYNDATLNIKWPECENYIVSEKDLKGDSFKDAVFF